ncbi:hypothetical protein [Peribacillus butanolivorans]|uniref:hypothetical protein n=1 Tax=Peribacillus butanolivorans TaxID=421767 RepID=UPI003672AB76
MIAEIMLFSNKEVSVIEIECEDSALSTLICFLNLQDKKYYYLLILSRLIDGSGTWNKELPIFKQINS